MKNIRFKLGTRFPKNDSLLMFFSFKILKKYPFSRSKPILPLFLRVRAYMRSPPTPPQKKKHRSRTGDASPGAFHNDHHFAH